MIINLFPFREYWWFYMAFTGFVWLLLAVDLGIFHRAAHDVSFREAAIWSTVWVALALAFNYMFYQYALWTFSQDPRLTTVPAFNPQAAAQQTALEFLTGYIVEKSLSVDNIFVFVVVFSYFAIPTKYQHRVLFFGILGALACRALFIALGAVLRQYHWVVWLFGAFLIITVATVITLLGWLSTPGAWAQSGGQPGTTTEQQPKVWYASTLLGADVKNPQGETLGEIAELLIDPKEARITMVVISVGGFLGLGAKSVAVPWSEVTPAPDGKSAVVAKGKEELEQAPSWER